MFTKKKSPPASNKAKASKKSAKAKKTAADSQLPALVAKVLAWLPAFGVLCLTVIAGILFWQLSEQGEKEGSLSYISGRYALVNIESGKVTGHLLPPAHTAPTSLIPDVAPEIVEPELNQPNIAVPEADVQLRSAPNMALTESDEGKILPKKSADGTASWEYYARPSTPTSGTKPIGVIITGLGMNNDLSLAAARLPAAISFSVSPYAQSPSSWVKSFRVQGHECFMDMPIQLNDYPLTDPGPKALQARITPKENLENLHWLLGQAIGYVGFVTPHNEVFFDAQKDFIEPVATELYERGLAVVFSDHKERPALDAIMDDAELVHLKSQIFINYGEDAASIRRELEAAEAVATQSGQALVVIEASPVAIQELEKWAKKLRLNGYQLVPASALARKQFS